MQFFKNKNNHDEVYVVFSEATWVAIAFYKNSDGSAELDISFRALPLGKAADVSDDEPITKQEFLALMDKAKNRFNNLAQLLTILVRYP